MRLLWEYLHTSLWPVPLLMLLAAVALAEAMRLVDLRVAGTSALPPSWLYSGTGGDARNLLSTLASSIITIAGVVFSITVVALSLAANQFGSRLVRSYMLDLRTKLSLGFFLMTTVYCLLALRRISETMPAGQVPHATVTAGLLLSVLCLLVLVVFLHVVAKSIVADEVIRRVAAELDQSIEGLPAKAAATDRPPGDELLPVDFESEGVVLRAAAEGYVEQIHYERLAAHAARLGLVVRLDVAAGDYMCRQGWLGNAHPADRCSPAFLRAVADAVVIGPARTPVQDLAFSVRHLVDIALRALSPGVNDPNTALVVIDRLRGALARVLGKSLATRVFNGDDGRCCVVARRHSHADLLAAALRPIRDAAARQPLVIVAMLQALGKLAEHADDAAQRSAILHEAALIAEAGLLEQPAPSERAAIEAAQRQLADKLRLVQQRARDPARIA